MYTERDYVEALEGLEALLTICWTHVINALLSFIQLELLELYHHGPHARMPTNIRTLTSPNCKSTTRPSGWPPPTCSPSWYLHNVSNHQNYDNNRARDVMWVQSNFFFFLWDSINDYYTDILWMVNYNKASMTSNESTKRARDALCLKPRTFWFSSLLIINLQIYPPLFNK